MDYTDILTDIYNILQAIYCVLLFIVGTTSACGVLFILYNFLKKFI